MWKVELEEHYATEIVMLKYWKENSDTRRPISFKQTSFEMYLQHRHAGNSSWFKVIGFQADMGFVKLENEP